MSELAPQPPIWERKGMTEDQYKLQKAAQIGRIATKLIGRGLEPKASSTLNPSEITANTEHPDIKIDFETKMNDADPNKLRSELTVKHTKQISGTRKFEDVYTKIGTSLPHQETGGRKVAYVSKYVRSEGESDRRRPSDQVAVQTSHREDTGSEEPLSKMNDKPLNGVYVNYTSGGSRSVDLGTEQSVTAAAAMLSSARESIRQNNQFVQESAQQAVEARVNDLISK